MRERGRGRKMIPCFWGRILNTGDSPSLVASACKKTSYEKVHGRVCTARAGFRHVGQRSHGDACQEALSFHLRASAGAGDGVGEKGKQLPNKRQEKHRSPVGAVSRGFVSSITIPKSAIGSVRSSGVGTEHGKGE